ncbi:hypothetical protein [Rhodobium gokarnense]|uniref:Uncharacterized protein n=1 Tax=Rhodobium gokarnense TaxID=364296 RepID=A0ABT3H8K6_9HYPH|nr:hypothetical protein [Rhodobium gokarnense]MCW2306733.1 hypothetical protein [Rhodobium gokarnense]
MKRDTALAGLAVLAPTVLCVLALVSPPAAAQGWSGSSFMPSEGTVRYEMSLQHIWSPARMRMTGTMSGDAAGIRQTHCLQMPATPVMTCQRTVNGEPGPIYQVPAAPFGTAEMMPRGFGGYPGGVYPGFGGYPGMGGGNGWAPGSTLPGFGTPPFSFPGGPYSGGPEMEMSGSWEWQGWRISGRFVYSPVVW